MGFRSMVLYAVLGLSFVGGHPEAAINPIVAPVPIHEAFLPKFADATVPSVVPTQPPAPLAERISARPEADLIWIPGYWAWVEMDMEFRWVCGVWRRPPPGQVWISGAWTNFQGGWTWVCGFWSPVPQEQLTYINTQPPAAIDDKSASSSLDNQFWIPGYWEYSAASRTYTWLSGKWAPFNAAWLLAPANYVWRPSGYVFSPIYWDYPLDKRGNAYACEVGDAPVIIESGVILQQMLWCYPDYIPIYWHWWHFHPGWWDGCWCMPPWWGSPGWWACPWADIWGLWWWWGHPGFFPPWWLSLELAMEIAPPQPEMIDFMKKFPKPNFPFQPGKLPILPQGPPTSVTPPRPNIPNDVPPGGQVTPPRLPPADGGRQVTPPPPPSLPRSPPPYYPPKRPYYPPVEPSTDIPDTQYPSYPIPPHRPPQVINPPDIIYPEHPPRRPHYPPLKPRPDDTPNYNPNYNPNFTPDNPRVPPSRTGPNYNPNFTPSTPQTPPSRTGPNYSPNYRPNFKPSTQQPNLNYTPRKGKG